jgi:hypothetical protein
MQTIVLLLAFRGIAISLILQATFTTALAAVSHRSLPRASSLVNSTRFIAQALGVAVLATVLGSTLSADVRRVQQESMRSTRQTPMRESANLVVKTPSTV